MADEAAATVVEEAGVVVAPPRLSNRRKAAIMAVALGPNLSAEVFKHLSQDEIDELRAILASVMSEDEEAVLRAKIREVRDTLNMDGRAIVGHLKKTLGCHTPYATVSLALNALNNMIGKGLHTIK